MELSWRRNLDAVLQLPCSNFCQTTFVSQLLGANFGRTTSGKQPSLNDLGLWLLFRYFVTDMTGFGELRDGM